MAGTFPETEEVETNSPEMTGRSKELERTERACIEVRVTVLAGSAKEYLKHLIEAADAFVEVASNPKTDRSQLELTEQRMRKFVESRLGADPDQILNGKSIGLVIAESRRQNKKTRTVFGRLLRR